MSHCHSTALIYNGSASLNSLMKKRDFSSRAYFTKELMQKGIKGALDTKCTSVPRTLTLYKPQATPKETSGNATPEAQSDLG